LARKSVDFWTVSHVVVAFMATVHLEDGDCFNTRYLVNSQTGAFVQLVDLDDDDQISETELRFWERRLGITIPRPKIP
jgi:hypothetical protein